MTRTKRQFFACTLPSATTQHKTKQNKYCYYFQFICHFFIIICIFCERSPFGKEKINMKKRRKNQCEEIVVEVQGLLRKVLQLQLHIATTQQWCPRKSVCNFHFNSLLFFWKWSGSDGMICCRLLRTRAGVWERPCVNWYPKLFIAVAKTRIRDAYAELSWSQLDFILK